MALAGPPQGRIDEGGEADEIVGAGALVVVGPRGEGRLRRWPFQPIAPQARGDGLELLQGVGRAGVGAELLQKRLIRHPAPAAAPLLPMQLLRLAIEGQVGGVQGDGGSGGQGPLAIGVPGLLDPGAAGAG